MSKNILQVIRGKAEGGGGIKGTWDCTPITGDEFQIVDSFQATYDPLTKVAAGDWTGLTPTMGGVNFGVLKTDLALGNLAIGDVKKLMFSLTADILSPSEMTVGGLVFMPASFGSAAAAAAMLANMFATNGAAPTSFISSYGLSAALAGGVKVLNQIFLSNTSNPTGTGGGALSIGTGIDLTGLAPEDAYGIFMSYGTVPGETYQALAATPLIFDGATNKLVTIGQINAVAESPIIPTDMTLHIVLAAIPSQPGPIPPASIVVDMNVGPNAIVIDDIVLTTGSLNITQAEIDLFFTSPAQTPTPVIQAIFPLGTAVNDQYRIKIQSPAITGRPYGTLVTNNVIAIVDNIDAGQEKFRAFVDSDMLEARLAEFTPGTGEAVTVERVNEIERRISELVFYVRSPDPTWASQLTGQNAYDTFEQAYDAAVTQPLHLKKVIVFDDRSTSQRAETYFRSGDQTYYLVANNISLSTIRGRCGTLNRDLLPGGDPNISYNDLTHLLGRFDGLHVEGGSFAVTRGTSNYAYYDPFCVNQSPSALVDTPSGPRKALEIGDNTFVMLFPTSFNLNYWVDDNFIIGDRSGLAILLDYSETGRSNFPIPLDYNLYQYDGYHSTPGRVNGWNDSYDTLVVYLGENSAFSTPVGTANGGATATDFEVHTGIRHRGVNFGELVGCTHIEAIPDTSGPDPTLDLALTAISLHGGADSSMESYHVIQGWDELIAVLDAPVVDNDGIVTYTVYDGTFFITGFVGVPHRHRLMFEGVIYIFGRHPGISGLAGINYGEPQAGDPIPPFIISETVNNDGTRLKFESISTGGVLGAWDESLVETASVTYVTCSLYATQSATMGANVDVTYENCRFDMPMDSTYGELPSISLGDVYSNVRYIDCSFHDNTRLAEYKAEPIFDLTQVQVYGRLLIKDCKVVTPSDDLNGTPKRHLASFRQPTPIVGDNGYTYEAWIHQTNGVIIEGCTKTWDDSTYNENRLYTGPYKVIPNLVILDNDHPPVQYHNGKPIVEVYRAMDLPQYHDDVGCVVYPANTVFRIHGRFMGIVQPSCLTGGTEIWGATSFNEDELDGTFYVLGYGNTIRDIRLWGIQVYANASYPAPGTVDVPYTNYQQPPANRLDSILMSPENYATGVPEEPIRICAVDDLTAIPDLYLGMILLRDQPEYAIRVRGAGKFANNLYIENMDKRKASQHFDTNYERAVLSIDDGAYWTERLTIRNNELSQCPVTAGATTIMNLPSDARVVAHGNYQADGNGTSRLVGNTPFTHYIEVSGGTYPLVNSNLDPIEIAGGNFLGAPNTAP